MKKIEIQPFQFLTPNDLYRHDLCRLLRRRFFRREKQEKQRKKPLRTVRYEADVPCKAVSKLLNVNATVRRKADDVSKAVSKLLNAKATVRCKADDVSKAG